MYTVFINRTSVPGARSQCGLTRLTLPVTRKRLFFLEGAPDCHGRFAGLFLCAKRLAHACLSLYLLFLINTAHDIGMPVVQIGDMVAALQQLGATNFTSLTLPGDLHAFDYWETVKDQVLSFLAAGFADA